jgi:2-polyprenyl-3-methyl-5-hydroxy-6-metoxy-1,4-benzoquinol methylase
MERVACDLCGGVKSRLYLRSRDYVNRVAGEFEVVRCEGCGLLYTNPRPDREEMAAFYPPSTPYYIPDKAPYRPLRSSKGIYRYLLHRYRSYFPDDPRAPLTTRFLGALFIRWKGSKLDADGIPTYVKGGRLLEIGCSHGRFLYEMRQLGWEVSGLEMSPEAAALGQRLYDLTISQKTLETADLPPQTYNAVVMKMVLEHLPSPGRALKKVFISMKERGELIVIVPNIAGLEAGLFGRFFYGLQVPNHLYHFTPATLRRYLEENGFRVDRIIFQRNDADFRKSIENVIVDRPGWRPLRLLTRGFFRTLIRQAIVLLSLMGRTSRMTVFATKQKSVG